MAKPKQPQAKDFLTEARKPFTVVMAVLPDGTKMKITGHERAKLWTADPALAPPTIRVIPVPVRTRKEAMRLYDEFEHLLSSEMM